MENNSFQNGRQKAEKYLNEKAAMVGVKFRNGEDVSALKKAAAEVAADHSKTVELSTCIVGWSDALKKVVTIPKG